MDSYDRRMQCDYYAAGRCHSCQWMDIPYPAQVRRKIEQVASLIPAFPASRIEAHTSAEWNFRNKAKMAVGGTLDEPTLGLTTLHGDSTDLSHCPLYPPHIHEAFAHIKWFITLARLTPYDLQTGRGELKFVLVTTSPAGDLLVRFVVRSTESLTRVRKFLPQFQERVPSSRVVTMNVLPQHKAATEGDREIYLTRRRELPMQLGGITLYLRPQSFFQTNTSMAQALYLRVSQIVDAIAPKALWDLYCGVGGFALHAARPGRSVVGIEISESAIECARLSAAQAGLQDVTFMAGDAPERAISALKAGAGPEVVIVNPPRRGIGDELAHALRAAKIPAVVYSSCNPVSLARDIEALGCYQPESVEIFDMFPHTGHTEVLTVLRRR
ncbi:23S rRNA (uracil(1939)-C(5))-methyltransferase RlmD [Rarobacter incanus]|uniref:23S rRNA (Uracil747-C5)-methyltransferase n=1 Tax=Rarobacter incanus TaxID=153494 RepID=A0A542SMR2_9MICO|nr:23S rRNA (uracil(1939)-C(5))-methyltransferase RlmD [Rarobacter incanus]TQK75909.1 23S rRNA (uracil747-C5)-methyltransferase [Rarobacter incanus]